MPFIYEFKLNKVKIKGVEIGFITNRKWEEALDDCKVIFPFVNTETPFPMYGLLDIDVTEINNYTQRTVIGTKHYEYLIYSDRVTETTKYGNYRHEINALEYTAKLDTLIMSSLAKSRSVYKDTQASFITNDTINSFDIIDSTAYNLHARNEFVKFQDSYYANKEIVLPQVEQTYVSTTVAPSYYRRANAVISTNATLLSGTNPHVLSSSPATWKFPKGRWYIEYGYTGGANDTVGGTGFQWIYRFYINVIEEDELSMYDILNEIRHCVSTFGGIEDTVYYESTRVFNITSQEETYLKSVQAPQMFLDTATARQMLIFALSYVNAVPRLKWGSQVDTLKIEKFGESQGQFTEQNITDYANQQNTQQIGQRSYAKIAQALPNNLNNPTIYAPSQSGFTQVRATITEIKANEFEIKLPDSKPIYVPRDLITVVEDLSITAGVASYTFDYGDIELSLMPRWINKDEWLLKTITLNYPSIVTLLAWEDNLGLRPNRVGNLSWQIGDTSIKLSDVYGDLFQDTLIRNVVTEQLREYVVLNPPIYIDGSDVMETDYRIAFTIPSEGDYLDWRFRVEYITDETIVTKQDKKDISQINFYSEMRINQDESIVNIVRQTKKNDAIVQRTGNIERSFQKIHKHLIDEYAIGTRDVNKYTITEITTQWYNEYFINTYYLTRYHNRIQQATYVDQTYRWRDNYAKTVFNRHEHYGDYLMVVPPDDTEVTETITKIYTNFTIKRVVEMLLGTSSGEKTKASVAVVRTDGMLEVYPDEEDNRKMIVVPLSSYGIEGGFSFTFGFSNNQVAGIQLALQGSKYYNQAVRYTDEWGRFTRFGFWILSDLEIAEADMLTYPLLTDSNYLELYNADVQYFGCGFMNSDNGAGEPLLVNKDPLTNYVQTYELKMLSYYVGLYVFGTKFYTDNFIVNNPTIDNKPYLYLYRDGTYYDLLEDLLKVKTTYSTVIELDSSNCSFDIDTLQYRFIDIDFEDGVDVTSWAIGNAQGDLYVACNEPLNGFDIIKTHIRPNVSGIGRLGYFNKIYEISGNLSMAMNFSYVKGNSVPLSFPMGMNMGMNFAYYKSKDIGVDLSSNLALSNNFVYYKGKMLDFDLSSSLALAQTFEYRRSKDIGIDLSSALSLAMTFDYRKRKDIGFNLNGSLSLAMEFTYGIGDSLFYQINSALSLANNFVYYRSKDIGIDLSATMSLANTFEYYRSKNIVADVSATMLMANDFIYHRSKDIGISLNGTLGMSLVATYERQMVHYNVDGTMSMANNFAYRKSYNIGFSLNSTLSMALSIAYTKAFNKATSPTISNKSVTEVKAWTNSTEIYWNAQDPSNRGTYVGETLPSASGYAVDFAMRKADGSLPAVYTYHRVIKTGDSVTWKITNNDEATCTVYCKVGTSSYLSYGSLASGATTSTLSRTVTNGLTTVYAYVVVTGKSNSDEVSL